LTEVNENGIAITENLKKSKKKTESETDTQIKFDFDQIKEAKVIITF